MAAMAASLDSAPCVFQGQDAMIKVDAAEPTRLRVVVAGTDSTLAEIDADTVVRVRERAQLSEVVITTLKDPGALLCFGTITLAPQETKLRVSADNLARICRDIRGFAGLPPTDDARTFLVILNPVSGSGKSRDIFEDVVRPALKAGNIDVKVELTTASGSARDIARGAGATPEGSPQAWDGIIVFGGDGTVMEVQEGNLLGARLPVAIMPTGSDNALAATLGIWSFHDAVLAAFKGPVIASDCMAVHEVNGDGTVGRLLGNPSCICGIGFTADVIHEIHTHRWSSGLAPASRTLFYGLRQFFCLGLGRHHARVLYTPSAARLTRCQIPDGRHCATCEEGQPAPARSNAGPVEFGLSPVTALSIGTMRAKNMSTGPDTALYPYAHFGDGALDVVAVGDVPEIEFFRRAFCVVIRGRVDTGYRKEYVKATEVFIEHVPVRGSSNAKFVLNLDGDPRYPQTDRVVCRVLPRAARLHAYRRLKPEPPRDAACADAVLDAVDGGLSACAAAWLSVRHCFGYSRGSGVRRMEVV